MVGPKPPFPRQRRYPPFWEKFIPAALLVIAVIIVLLVFVTVRVALGLAALPF